MLVACYFLCVSTTWVLNSKIILGLHKTLSKNFTYKPTLNTLYISVRYNAPSTFFHTISSILFDIHPALRFIAN